MFQKLKTWRALCW